MRDKFLHAVDVVFKQGDNKVFSFLMSANALTTDQGVIGIVVVMVDNHRTQENGRGAAKSP